MSSKFGHQFAELAKGRVPTCFVSVVQEVGEVYTSAFSGRPKFQMT